MATIPSVKTLKTNSYFVKLHIFVSKHGFIVAGHCAHEILRQAQ